MYVKLFGLHLIRLQDFPVCAHIVITNKMNTDNWCVYLGKYWLNFTFQTLNNYNNSLMNCILTRKTL